jgi:hypothetical protein
MTLVHMGTVISPLRVEARASIIVVASIVTLTIRGSADTNSKTRTLNIDSLRRSARHPDPRTSMSYSVNSYATLHHLSKRHSNAPIADLCFSLLTPMERYIIYSSRTWAPAFPFCFYFYATLALHRSVGPFLQDSEALIGACQAPQIGN